MKRFAATVLFVGLALSVLAAQRSGIIKEVRVAIAADDFALGDKALAAYRDANGITPEWLEALSWMGRGSLAGEEAGRSGKVRA